MVGMMAQRLEFVGLALVLLRKELSAFVQVTLDLSRNMGWRDKQFTNVFYEKRVREELNKGAQTSNPYFNYNSLFLKF